MNEILDVIIIGAGSAGLAALREVKKRTVGSTDRCNTFSKFSAWRHESKNFSWP